MDEFAVLVFHDQPLTDTEHLAFAERLDGNEALGDISNLGTDGEILAADDRRRAYGLGNRLWHTDASFQDPPGR